MPANSQIIRYQESHHLVTANLLTKQGDCGGMGQDTRTVIAHYDQKTAAIADVTKEPLKRLNVNLPESVMKQFKVKAVMGFEVQRNRNLR